MAGQGSARVTLREIDLSQVRNPQQQPQGVPAAVVGPASKGPAFVPRTFANMQQFEEVFGSMRERGYSSNSNLFGPMALNEWMRSANAGTYVRVLGVGDGLKASGGKTNDAGFVVGERQVQEQASDVGKVGDNPHASITDTDAALLLGRTQFLGCFMKDSAGSSYLTDAGVQSEEAAGSLIIEFTAPALVSDTVSIKAVDDEGSLSAGSTFEFNNGVAIGANALESLTNLKDSIKLDGDLGTGRAHEVVVVVEDISLETEPAGTRARMTLTSNFAVASDATNLNEVTFNLNAGGVIVGQKTGSVSSQTFSYGIEGDTKASVVIETLRQAKNDATIALTAVSNDGNNTVDDTKIVTYTFKDGLPSAYNITANNTASVKIGVTKEETLLNLKSAILDTQDGQASDHRGLFTALLNEDGSKLTVTQVNGGVEGNTAVTISAAGGGVAGGANDTGLSVEAFDRADQVNAIEQVLTSDGANQTGFMNGGTNGTETSFTLSLSGQPNDRDELRVKGRTVANGVHEQIYIFSDDVAATNGGDDVDAVPNAINIKIGESVTETLINIKKVFDKDSPQSTGAHNDIEDQLDSFYDEATSSVKIFQVDFADGLATKYEMTFKVGESVTLTNPDGDRLVGNFGQKVENFSGGGGAAAPIIRGVLMTPQGVKASLDVPANLDDFVDSVEGASHIRGVAHGKDFGNTAGTNLTGYMVGEVAQDQGFKIILNGYSNTQNPAVLSCSFDPNSPSYISKVLNTDPTKMEELGHYLYAWWDVNPAIAAPSNDGLRHIGGQISGVYERMIGFLVEGASGRDGVTDGSKPNYENFESKFRTAKTPWIVSQFYGSDGDLAARPLTSSDGGSYRLFKLHALDDGEVSNGQFRLLIENLRYDSSTEYGSFDMTLESFSSDAIRGVPLATWKNASLDSNSRNFIGRLIGDKHIYYDFDRDQNKQRLREEGQYAQKNPYVRIELSDDLKQGNVPVDALPTGFQGHAHLSTKLDGNFIEQVDLAEKRIFTLADNSVTETLSQAVVAPMDFVKSINRNLSSTSTLQLESDTDLAWGVKFGLRERAHNNHAELAEQVFNKSIYSWAKFFPDFGSNAPLVTDGDDTDKFQRSFFSLEKILIPAASLSSDKISTWDGAIYQRDNTATPTSGDRFVTISKDARGGNSRYLKFRCMFQGGFDGLNIFDEQKHRLTGVASLREGEDETGTSKFTGPTIMAYTKALDVLTDKAATEFQLLAIPGQRTPRITDHAINACEERFDALYVMDIVDKNASGISIEDELEKSHVRNTITDFSNRVLDTSFAAAYYPDVLMRRPSDNAPVLVPPSVGMLGVMSRNDAIADPWFAPAGLNRGRLSAIDSKVQMNRDLLDELYDADINPIYVPAGRSGEVYAFGQKTLLQDQSALDRINVRRLLIDIRRKVKKVGEQLLFEPNRASTLSRFSALVEPIMANVQQRRGVTRYKVQIDSSTTTQNDIENNTIRGKIYLQPTKSVEFISLDFVVTNTIQQ